MRPLILLAALLLTLAACGGVDDSIDVTDGGAEDGEAMAATPPEGIWVLTDSTPDIGVPDGARASLRLEVTDGRTLSAGGDTPCNGFGGTATTTADGGWEWQLDGITEMGCEPDRTSAQDAYVEALAAAHTFRLDSGDLLLTGDEVELRFALQEPVESSGLVGTDWVLTGFVDGDTVSAISWADPVRDATLRLDGDPEDGGTFTLFSGCRDFDGEWVTDGDTVQWPSWGQSDDSRDIEDCNASEVEAEGMVLAAVEGGFTVELQTQDVGSFLTIRSASDGTTGLAFRGPQDGEDDTQDAPTEE